MGPRASPRYAPLVREGSTVVTEIAACPTTQTPTLEPEG